MFFPQPESSIHISQLGRGRFHVGFAVVDRVSRNVTQVKTLLEILEHVVFIVPHLYADRYLIITS